MTILLWSLSFAVIAAVGIFAGFLWGRSNAHKHYSKVMIESRHEPLPRVTLLQRIFAVVIAMIAILLVVQNSVNSAGNKEDAEKAQKVALAQQQCNQDLYKAITARSDASEQDRRAFIQLVDTLIRTPPPTPEESQVALRAYREALAASDRAREANPYPEPRCGQ